MGFKLVFGPGSGLYFRVQTWLEPKLLDPFTTLREMLIEQITEFEIRRPGAPGCICNPITG